MSDCLKRSFEAGLRWCGINDEVPRITLDYEAQALAEAYGLTYLSEGEIEANQPAIIIYHDNYERTSSKYHAVFCSDVAPFSKWEICAAIIGFVELRNTITNP